MTTDNLPDAPRRGLEPALRASLVAVAGLGGLLAVGGAVQWGLRTGISVAVGALIATANLYALARVVGGVLGGRAENDPNAGMWAVLAILKIVVLFGGIWLLLGSHLVEPIALFVGWGALPVGIAAGTLLSDKTDRSASPRGKEAPPASSAEGARAQGGKPPGT